MPDYWAAVGPWVGEALRRGHCLHHTLETAYQGCLEGRMTLWVAVRDKPVACAITYVNQSRLRVCELFVVGGKDVQDWLPLERGIEQYARDMGCDVIEGSGRKGWGRIMPDYKEVHTVFRKEL